MQESARTFLKEAVKFLLKLLLAVGIIAILIWKTGDLRIMENLRAVNPLWLLPAAFFYAFHIFANAWRWWLLLRVQKIDCSLWHANSLTMQSFFFSLVMPGGAIGGDVVRAGFLARQVEKGRKFDGVFTILIDRFTGMIGIFLVAILMLPFTWWCIAGGDVEAGGGLSLMQKFIWALLAGSLAGLFAAFVVFKHRVFERFAWFRWMRDLSDRFTHGLFSKVEEALDSYQGHKKEIAICILASMVLVNINLAVFAYFVMVSVAGLAGASFTAALGAITVGNIAGLFTPTPSGIGGRDVFVAAILCTAGMLGKSATTATVIITLMIMGFNLLGGLFFLFSRHGRKTEAAEAK